MDMPPAKRLSASEKTLGKLMLTPVASDAPVFFVHKDTPVTWLCLEQVRDMYAGRLYAGARSAAGMRSWSSFGQMGSATGGHWWRWSCAGRKQQRQISVVCVVCGGDKDIRTEGSRDAFALDMRPGRAGFDRQGRLRVLVRARRKQDGSLIKRKAI